MLWKKYACEEAPALLAALETSAHGLSAAAAGTRLHLEGKNQMKKAPFPLGEIIKRRFRSAFFYLLLVAALLSYLLGDRVEALLIAAFLLINVSL